MIKLLKQYIEGNGINATCRPIKISRKKCFSLFVFLILSVHMMMLFKECLFSITHINLISHDRKTNSSLVLNLGDGVAKKSHVLLKILLPGWRFSFSIVIFRVKYFEYSILLQSLISIQYRKIESKTKIF